MVRPAHDQSADDQSTHLYTLCSLLYAFDQVFKSASFVPTPHHQTDLPNSPKSTTRSHYIDTLMTKKGTHPPNAND